MANSNDILDNAKSKMKKAQEVLERELSSIRAGRANASILNRVKVSYYGSEVPVNQVASISVPEPRVIMVTPYDKSSLDDVEKGILEADLGLNPANDGNVIRLVIPQLTEERRQELAKQVKAVGEESKVAVRNVRREAMDAVKKGNKNEDFTDDEAHGLENKVQKVTDDAISGVEKIVSDKEREITNN
ncbi:ribosome recycling factor [Lactobacillus sp. Sy-1]|uniref:ribosome recycling factor n=1 Tax=Lactobacillus sp. Sy-1 TaxID=2109645 RepID=UPI001C57B265|nr:ribosome recycling factor [Lactobacillus sp. Sy-1]MBW1605480.1 ribosome recycling factor [Lactobacillus sp. Sy-1]